MVTMELIMINDMGKQLEKSKQIALEDPERSFELASKVLESALESNLIWEIGQSYFCMAYACRVMSNYTDGLRYAYNSLAYFENLKDDEGILQARNIIGIIYFYYGDYKTSLENFSDAMRILEEVQHPKLKASILNNIGEIYRMANDYEKAIDYYKEALVISERFEIVANISIINANIGEIYYIQTNYDQAESYFNSAYEHSLNSNDPINKGEAQTKLGKIKLVKGQYDDARDCFVTALELFNKVNNKYYLVETLIAYAELDPKIGRNPRMHLMEALNYAIEYKLSPKISHIYEMLVNYHEKCLEYKTALKYHKLLFQNEKEIEASNLSRKLELLALEFDYYKEKSDYEQSKNLSEKLMRQIKKSKEELQEIKAQNITLIEASIIDELTQTYNRRGIKKLLSENIVKASPLYDFILMIDIDHFKSYNDYWGHLKGDQCLQFIAMTLKSMQFENYFLGRYGGEEFICYMKVADLDEAKEIAEKIRTSIQDLNIIYTDDVNSDVVTVSVGGVIDQMASEEITRYIDIADQWLYFAKKLGRNISAVGQGTTGPVFQNNNK